MRVISEFNNTLYFYMEQDDFEAINIRVRRGIQQFTESLKK